MNTKRFNIAGVLVALAVLALFAAMYAYPSIGAKSPLGTQSLGSVQPQTTPVLPTDDKANPPADKEQGAVLTHTVGVPAIPVRDHNTAADVAAFTEQDVRDYVSSQFDNGSHGFGRIGIAEGSTQPQVASVKFDTLSNLQSYLGQRIDMGEDSDVLLCAVVYNGDFTVSAPMSESIHHSHVAQIYDAHTGNLMAQIAYDDK